MCLDLCLFVLLPVTADHAWIPFNGVQSAAVSPAGVSPTNLGFPEYCCRPAAVPALFPWQLAPTMQASIASRVLPSELQPSAAGFLLLLLCHSPCQGGMLLEWSVVDHSMCWQAPCAQGVFCALSSSVAFLSTCQLTSLYCRGY